MPRPNILWYCTDQQRFDTIHALGNPEIRTPTLDRLVESGVAFARAYTQSPICTPSRATFLTGRYPSSHHVHRNGNDFFPPQEILVTKLLSGSGYDCGLAGKLHLSRACGRVEKRPDDGYRFFQWSHHPYPDWMEGHDYAEWLKKEKGVDPQELYGGRSRFYGPGIPTEYHQTTWCTEMAIRFIKEERSGPWLMSVNPFDPHPPFDPPEEFLSRYDPTLLTPPFFRERDLERQKAFLGVDQQTLEAVDPRSGKSPSNEGSGLSREEMARIPMKSYDGREVKACYYAMIELIDHQLGRIIDVLQETGQLENTVILFTSDHGELLGDHGLMYKGCRFFESLVHVPLLISWPERFAAGLRSDALVELVDIPPTLLDCAGIPVPLYMQGSSLFSILEGKGDPNRHKSHVVCEYNDALDLPNASHATMTFDGRYKVCLYHGTETAEIYDLEEDPGEFHNLWETWMKGEAGMDAGEPAPGLRSRGTRPGPKSPGLARLIPSLLQKHIGAVMRGSDAGIPRTGPY